MDTSSPRATLFGFLSLMEDVGRAAAEYEKTSSREQFHRIQSFFRPARRCFDFSEIPISSREESGAESVVLMWEVLTRIELPARDMVPDAAAMDALQEAGKPARWRIPHTAGVSVGGLAIALATQNSLENFLGSINLFLDRPVRVGELCQFGDQLGTVEEIGLRSTRIRGLDRTLTTVPNGDFSRQQITNLSRRDRILLKTTLGLRYETSADQLRHVLVELRKLLLAHPKVSNDPARVRFVGFGASSMDVEVYAYVLTPNYPNFLTIREDLYLRMIDLVEASGCGFAFPSQTLYLSRDSTPDTARARDAEERVREWRDESQLPFPDFTDDEVAAIQNTLDFPPEGSPQT